MITAALAKEMAQKAPERLEQQQLMDVMKDIVSNARHGRMSISLYYSMFPSTSDKLRELGFELTPISGGFLVSWGTQQEDFDISSEINDLYASLPAVQYGIPETSAPATDGLFTRNYPIRFING